jgi:CheY-like chemotaxis protein
MSREVLDRAFKPFFTTKQAGEGTGLGLATVYGIVTKAGGHVDLYSEPGAGTTARMLLPACFDEDVRADTPRIAVPDIGRGEKVLVVEDEDSVRHLVAKLLRDGGYEVVEAAGPAEALRLARDGGVDLLLTDVVMPGESGHELAQRLRAEQPGLLVLYMSGYTDDVVMRHGVFERRLAFVEKPFTRASLLKAVRETLDTPDGQGSQDG